MPQPMQTKLCDRLLSGYSQPKRCNRPAVAIVDAGTPYALPLCAEHAAECDPGRLTPIVNLAGGGYLLTPDSHEVPA